MNRQVPNKTYTIVGDGKVAHHFDHYFDLLEISHYQWHRQQSKKQLQQVVAKSDVVLILISDDAIDAFIHENSFLQDKTLVHFSGTLVLDNAFGCHPLMTFSSELYELNTYQDIPFVCDESVEFNEIFPKLKNKSFNIPAKQKAYYHAMCVMAGNFTQTLMRETANQLNENLGLPADILFPYLLQNTKNFIAKSEHSATGPLQRGDFATINKHLHVLKGNELEGLYKSFLKFSNIPIQQQCHPHKILGSESSENLDSCLRGNDGGFNGNNFDLVKGEAL